MVICLLVFGACKQSEFYEKDGLVNSETGSGSTGGTGTAPTEDDEDEPTLCENGSSDNLICNPLGGGEGTDPSDDVSAVPVSKLGLIAHLYEGQDQWNNLDKYFAEGYMHEEAMYFSNFDVALRAFDQGFGYGDSNFLKNSRGEKLIEWFALKAEGNLILPSSETSGSYHIVTISDDGIQITVDGKTILKNTNIHSATVDCATELVELNSGEQKSFELGYFQGPRMHIALMTFIKKIDDVGAFKKESFCSTGSGSDALIAKGYKVISPAWFTLPAGY